MHLKKPFFVYNDGLGQLEPDEAEDGHADRPQIERFDHFSASGKKFSYRVGPRDLLEVSFPWQSDAKKVEWLTFWDAVKDGSVFRYIMDDSVMRYGDGTLYGATGVKYGQDSDGDAITTGDYTLDNVELPIIQEEVNGYWRVGPLIMREVV